MCDYPTWIVQHMHEIRISFYSYRNWPGNKKNVIFVVAQGHLPSSWGTAERTNYQIQKTALL